MEKDNYTKLKEIINKRLKENQEIILINIGTDRSTGDSVGPLTGTFLSKTRLENIISYGTIDDPIHALNMEEKIKEIKTKHPNSLKIAIDAAISDKQKVGTIHVKEGGVKPGSPFGKNLAEVGDISINIIMTNTPSYQALGNVRLKDTFKLAEETKNLIKSIDNYLSKKTNRKSETLKVVDISDFI